ncbi:unnamed protein product [Paramecium sonneborni]|uniref:P-type ATPase N-terminal domain-containing protein n=1 Tax=Paramecium sonneborni TaxID=65129 RepID=A0A8S1M043_9CILI|nr:unnamed protein product [Paramecium sonneborni]
MESKRKTMNNLYQNKDLNLFQQRNLKKKLKLKRKANLIKLKTLCLFIWEGQSTKLIKQFHKKLKIQCIYIYPLSLTITQCISFLKVGFLIDYLGPLALVVAISLLKELYDDIQRHMRDHQINNYEYGLITRNGIEKISSGNIKVGQIVEVKCNERIPADLLVLYADDEQGNVFIRTDQLDGETDWKLRKAVKATQNLIKSGSDPSLLISSSSYVTCQEPIANIYQFSGLFNYKYQKESLSLEHVMWANTVLATGRIYGLVILNGKETRMEKEQQNTKDQIWYT